MSSDVQELERTIEADRTMLERTLSQLSQALSPEQIWGTIAREVQARSGPIGRTLVESAKANPAGTALVGLGVAAVLAGPKRPKSEPAYDTRSKPLASGMSDKQVLTGEFDRRVAAAEAAQQSEPLAPKMRAALNKGLANLPAPARERVIQAREAAIAAQEKVDRSAAIAARKARSFYQRQPLSTAAVAAGLGAVAAALLPRTRTEDRLLGAKRDALLQQAEFALRDEIAAATVTGEAALRDGIEAGLARARQH